MKFQSITMTCLPKPYLLGTMVDGFGQGDTLGSSRPRTERKITMQHLKNFIMLALSLTLLSAVYAEQNSKQETTGLITVISSFDMDTTQARLEQAIEASPLTLIFSLDHQANAAKVDKELRPTRLFLFGNPNVGTPLMQNSQSVAIDLPQKMLIWQAEDGQVYLSYNDPMYLAERHALTGQEERLAMVANALANLARAASQAE